MKLVVVILILSIASTVRAADSSATSSAQNQNAHYHEAAKEYARLAVNLAKTKYWNSRWGFTVPPMKIYDESGAPAPGKQTPRMKQLDQEEPLLWKGVAFEIGDLYGADQKTINDKRVRHSRAIRRHLSDALKYACSARGGGSASMVLNAIEPAQTEWIIKCLSVNGHKATSDRQFVTKLKACVGDYNPSDIHESVAALKKAERLLTSSERASLRYEFLSYFGE
jgi:hypothetical protein